jgi:hypothetical protein
MQAYSVPPAVDPVLAVPELEPAAAPEPPALEPPPEPELPPVPEVSPLLPLPPGEASPHAGRHEARNPRRSMEPGRIDEPYLVEGERLEDERLGEHDLPEVRPLLHRLERGAAFVEAKCPPDDGTNAMQR